MSASMSRSKLFAWAAVSVLLASGLTVLSKGIELAWQIPLAKAKWKEAEAAAATPPALIKAAEASNYAEVVMTDTLLRPITEAASRILAINKRTTQIDAELRRSLDLKTHTTLSARQKQEREAERQKLLIEKETLVEELQANVDEFKSLGKYAINGRTASPEDLIRRATQNAEALVGGQLGMQPDSSTPVPANPVGASQRITNRDLGLTGLTLDEQAQRAAERSSPESHGRVQEEIQRIFSGEAANPQPSTTTKDNWKARVRSQAKQQP